MSTFTSLGHSFPTYMEAVANIAKAGKTQCSVTLPNGQKVKPNRAELRNAAK